MSISRCFPSLFARTAFTVLTALASFAAFLVLTASGAMPACAAERVVIVVLDGLRSSEGFDDPGLRFIPRMGRDLAPQGALVRTCDNMGQTLTIPGHAAIASGRYQNLPDDGGTRSVFPLLWEYYRAANGASDRDAVIVTTKTKIRCLTYSTYSTYGAADSARAIGPTWNDSDTVQQFLLDMVVNRPIVSMLNLGQIDGEGHTGDWARYTRAIQRADSAVAILWEGIQRDPIFGGRTNLIITGDHGRHADGYGDWSEHGDGCPGCRRIPLLALGPDFRRGMVSWTPCQQVDICKTVAFTINLSVPLAGGRVLGEILEQPAFADGSPAGGEPLRIAVSGNRARFASDRAGAISLFDVNGRTLASGRITPRADWSWDSPVSGLFFYRFSSPARERKGRIVLIR